jgi:hypothetical protein
MFRFNDEFIANKQKEKTAELLEGLLKNFNIEHSSEIEKFFDANIKDYDFVEGIPALARTQDQLVRMLFIESNSNANSAKIELRAVYDNLTKSLKDPIPFIEFSFPSRYKCKHGENYKHVYVFFITNFKTFDESQDSVLYYLNRMNNLKVFL